VFERLAERFADVTLAGVRAAVPAIHCALGAPARGYVPSAVNDTTPETLDSASVDTHMRSAAA
jgi:hypothetical protein